MELKTNHLLVWTTMLLWLIFTIGIVNGTDNVDVTRMPSVEGSGYSGNPIDSIGGMDISGGGMDAIMPTGRLAPEHALLTQFNLKNVDRDVWVGASAKIYVSNLDVMKHCFSTCFATYNPAKHFEFTSSPDRSSIGSVLAGASWVGSLVPATSICSVSQIGEWMTGSYPGCAGFDNSDIETKIAQDVLSGGKHNPPRITRGGLSSADWFGSQWFNGVRIPIGNAIAPGHEKNFYWWVVAKTHSKMTPLENTDYCNSHSLSGVLSADDEGKSLEEYKEKCVGDHTYGIQVGYDKDNPFYSAEITYRVTPPEVEGTIAFLQLMFIGAMALAGFYASGAGRGA